MGEDGGFALEIDVSGPVGVVHILGGACVRHTGDSACLDDLAADGVHALLHDHVAHGFSPMDAVLEVPFVDLVFKARTIGVGGVHVQHIAHADVSGGAIGTAQRAKHHGCGSVSGAEIDLRPVASSGLGDVDVGVDQLGLGFTWHVTDEDA